MHAWSGNRPQITKIEIMSASKPSHFITWFFIAVTFLPPVLVLVGAGFSGVSLSECGLIAVAFVICASIGTLLGLLIQPRSPNAGLGVLLSPLVSIASWLLIALLFDVCFQRTLIPRFMQPLNFTPVSILFLSVPTAGFVRATHWLRDHQS